jgi:hypothetical protein
VANPGIEGCTENYIAPQQESVCSPSIFDPDRVYDLSGRRNFAGDWMVEIRIGAEVLDETECPDFVKRQTS